MSDTPIVRFAPSPTGHIHIGNARTALFNALYALATGGRFILRFDDTDPERSRQEFAEAIAADLAWLGVSPDLVAYQSKRFDRYDLAVETLKSAGRLYPCYETPDELDRRRARQRARGLPPVYDRASLKLGDAERAAFEAEGRKPHWRFLLDNHEGDPFAPRATPVVFEDLCRGLQTVDLATVSDPVLIRGDGSYLYTLPSVVDDIEMGVTHVIRGEDHVTNAGVQVDLFKALGGEAPVFAHHNLLTLASGEGLSKRSGALSIGALRDDGLEAMTVAATAVLIGTAEAVRPVADLTALSEIFDLSKVSRAPAKFDPDDLVRLNAKLLHDTPYRVVADRLGDLEIGGGEAFWAAVQGNLERLADARLWWGVVEGPVNPTLDPDGADVLAAATANLPPEPWNLATWAAWTATVKDATGAKGRRLFMPLRLALTGQSHGPELAGLLPLIGPRKVAARLAGQAA